MKRTARLLVVIALLLSMLTYGATALFFEDCDLVNEAVAFHCGGSDAEACFEAIHFHEIACQGLPRR